MIVKTHLGIDPRLCGEALEVRPGGARVALETLPQMAADEAGLVHGGFVFGLADYAAMLAVNHPHVVLAGATVRLHKPVAVGQRLVAEAGVVETAGRKAKVTVEVACEGVVVMSGTFDCVTLDRHVLAPEPVEPVEPVAPIAPIAPVEAS